MKVKVKGSGTTVDLQQRDFIAKGGEGSIYGKGDTAYKIYEDRSKMIPMAKIQELAELRHPNIIAPQSLLLDGRNNTVGYTMRLLKDTYALCQLFTKSFKQRNGVAPNKMVELVKKLRELIDYVHSKHCLVVDLNEMNFLADKKLTELYAIAILPSNRHHG